MPRRLLIAIAAGTLVLIVAVCLWFAPYGAGEYADSPDGRYRASVDNMVAGTLLRGRVQYIRVTVTERGSEEIVWHVQRYPQATSSVPDYGDRSQRFIEWAPDSRSVSVPVDGTTVLKLPIP